jgi:uncharacterized protein
MTCPRHLRPWLLVVLLACALAARAEKIADIHPDNYVTDLAAVLTPATVTHLNALCGEVERKTGAQIAVVTVKSLDGRSVEDYAVDLFKQLGVGGKTDNRGILILLAPNDRRYRFEVGYGLEPVINDARAGDIGREIVPYLRANNFDLALHVATLRVAARIADAAGVTLDAAPRPVRTQRPANDNAFPWWIFPLGFFVVPTALGLLRRHAPAGRRYSRGTSGWWIGPGGFGGGGFGGGGFGGGFGGFGGGSSGGGGASGSW